MSTGYIQKNKKDFKKRLLKGIKIFPKKKKNQKRQYAREKCQNLSEEEKEKKHRYCLERHKNLSEDEKQKISECRRNYYITDKK